MSSNEMNPKTDSSDQEARRRRGIYLLPNLLTTAGLFAGFYCVVAGMRGQFTQAAIAIFISMLADGSDGRVARLTNTQTAFGEQYDSLADLVSFGMAPACLLYSWSLMRLGKLGWLAAFIYVAATALRLARFNTQTATADKRYFQGLPSPASAGVVVGLVWSAHDFSWSGYDLRVLVAIVTVALATAMVSNLRYHSFKEFNLQGRIPFVASLVVVLMFATVALDPPRMLFLLFGVYALMGPVWTIWARRRANLRRREQLDAE